MRAANKTSIDIIGGVIVEIKVAGPLGSDRSTKQVVYIANNASKVFLSQEACKQLGLIHKSFPNNEVASACEVNHLPHS